MGFIQLAGVNDVHEPEMAPEGEYAIQITGAEDYVNANGRTVIQCDIEFEDHPEYSRFRHWLALPDQALDIDKHPEGAEEGQKKFNRMLLGARRFCTLWGVPLDNGFETADLIGARAVAKVTQEERDDQPGTMNQRLIVPRIQE